MAAPDTHPASISIDDVRSAIVDGMTGTSRLPQGTDVAANQEGIAAEIMGENQASTQGNAAGANDALAAKEIEATRSQGITDAAQAIGDAAVEAPFINPDGTLLNAQNAVIDPNKIINYALNPTPNQSGGDNKAIVFNSALGYNQSNAADLIQQLQAGVSNYPATVAGVNNYGNRFTVNIPVTGPNGNTLPVTTGWIYDPGSKTPRLITAYIK